MSFEPVSRRCFNATSVKTLGVVGGLNGKIQSTPIRAIMLYCINANPKNKLQRGLAALAPVGRSPEDNSEKMKLGALSFSVVRGKHDFDGAERLYAGQAIVAD